MPEGVVLQRGSDHLLIKYEWAGSLLSALKEQTTNGVSAVRYCSVQKGIVVDLAKNHNIRKVQEWIRDVARRVVALMRTRRQPSRNALTSWLDV